MEQRKVFNLVILDESGSMRGLEEQAVAGVNETISTIKKSQNDFPNQSQYFSFYTFSSHNHIKCINYNQPIAGISEFNQRDYNPNRGTALYDAIGHGVRALNDQVKKDDNVLVTIITDGMENDSKLWSKECIKKLIEDKKEKGWVFTYIGANQDVEQEARKISIDNRLHFEATVEGTISMFERENRARCRWNERVNRHEENLERGYYEEPEHLYYPTRRITPKQLSYLNADEVFVFGSNKAGIHNGGAAAYALHNFGARLGQAEGIQGKSYGIPTVGVNRDELQEAIDRFCVYAVSHPEKTFYVTAIGCGHGGWNAREVSDMFKRAKGLENITLPEEFLI